MMDDGKAEEGEEGEVDENGLPVCNKKVSGSLLTLCFFHSELDFLTLYPFL